jgi:hypothetical protein
MRKVTNFFMVLLLTSSAMAATETVPPKEPPKDYRLAWSTSLTDQYSIDTLSNQKNEIALGFVLKFDMDFSPWMSINLTPNFVAQNGYIQSPNAVDPQSSRIDILNASLDLKPADFFNLSVGSLSQREYHSSLFMSQRSFPAARIVSNIGAKTNDHFYFFVETAMPTSSSISNNASDLNQTPSLNMGGLGGIWGSERTMFSLLGGISAYQFSGLSQDLSTASVLLGNTGVNTAGTTYLFQYTYQGFDASLAFNARATRSLVLKVWANAVQNSNAPSGSNQGWAAGTGFKYDINRLFQIEPKFEYFQVQSDATVSIYNDEIYNTNRTGYRTELDLKYNRKISLMVQYGQRVAIRLNPSQPSESFYLFGFETTESHF